MNEEEPVVTIPEQEELTDLVARILYKAKFPLRRWSHTKDYHKKPFVIKARQAIERIRREDSRSGQTPIFERV